MTEIEQVQRETGITFDPERVPRHIAIIMDGNGRWATRQSLPRVFGHQRGYETVQDIVRACHDLGVSVLTLYTFSTENWRRPRAEVEALMALIELAARDMLPTMQENSVKLRVSGRFAELPESLRQALTEGMEATANNKDIILNLAINYGGRREILDAVQEAARRVRDGEADVEQIDEDYFSGLLYTAELPDPDLLIRTASEMRISNFLLWQIAYSEIWVTPTLWPDFTKTDLVRAIFDYQQRTRKFGGIAK